MSALAVVEEHHGRGHTRARIEDLKEAGEDFEWYPTTDEIIHDVKKALLITSSRNFESEWAESPYLKRSVLDIGAGDGRVLNMLTVGDKYAIEKSMVHVRAMPREIFVVGADFQHQTLLDKRVDLTFCNPPYREFESWAAKIISESRSGCIVLVLPVRWVNSPAIAQAMKLRGVKHYSVVGEYTFSDADSTARAARARVQAVIIDLSMEARSDWSPRRRQIITSVASGGNTSNTDPFSIWFDENFPLSSAKRSNVKADLEERMAAAAERKGELVKREGTIRIMEHFYNSDLNRLMELFSMLCGVDGDLLAELSITKNSVAEILKSKITGLKDVYWRKLFDNFDAITSRLTLKSRNLMFDKLTKNTHIDFNAANCYAVADWVIKNANHYFDDQVIALVERMRSESSVILYKSNDRVFKKEAWRYNRAPDDLDRYKLDYRFVISIGAIGTDYRYRNGLTEGANNFLSDIMTVAHNLGYDTTAAAQPRDVVFEAGQSREFTYFNHDKGKEITLFAVRAFGNGNMHLKFNAKFMCRLNVEFGRLMGWLKTAEEAVDEIIVPSGDKSERPEELAELAREIKSSFGTNLRLGAGTLAPLLGTKATIAE